MSILVLEKEEFFGYDALDRFIKLRGTEKSIFIHKMNLISPEGRELQLSHAKIYTKILDYIVRKVKERANETLQHAKHPENIEYVITIPSHWKYSKKDLMKTFNDAIKESGEIKGAKRTITVSKAEVVSPFLHEVKADVLCQNFNVDHLSFSDETKYAILDIGSSACELTILTAQKEGKDQADEPDRREWGTKSVEDGSLNFLNRIFGLDVMEDFERNKAELEELHLSFEKIKTNKNTFKLGAEPVEILYHLL
ncbi:uncharacterized protein LOC134257522 [Saccostrea cucullata]|uniref:uncharacterized protein LOC134257522 n=1 Tax=Saccostrea cuccullata TaxID=36930 RepID=UPI002ED2E351